MRSFFGDKARYVGLVFALLAVSSCVSAMVVGGHPADFREPGLQADRLARPIMALPGHIAPINGPRCPNPADDSITGRNPASISCAQMHVLHAEYADYRAHQARDTQRTAGGKWMERVHAAALEHDAFSDGIMYQMTGDPAWANLAVVDYTRNTGDPIANNWRWQCLGYVAGTSPCASSTANGHCVSSDVLCGLNVVTFGAPEFEIEYDLLYSGLTTGNQDRFAAWLNDVWTDWALREDYVIHDTDTGLLGPYMGIMTWYQLTKDSNPQIVTAVNNFNCAASDGCVGLGGLDPSRVAGDRTTLRNAIYDLVTRFAGGGEWVVSPEYNVDDLRSLVTGRNALVNIMAARGDTTDHFPEVTAWLSDGLLYPLYETTPDFRETLGWGDTAFFRQMMVPRTLSVLMGAMLGGKPADANATYAQDWLLDLADATAYVNSNPINQSAIAQMEARGLLWYPNDTVVRGDRTSLPHGRYEDGQGFTFYHDGWAPKDSMFSAQFPHFRFTCATCGRWEYTDHAPLNFGVIQLYRQGGWALTYPQNYGSFADGPSGTNSWALYNDSSLSRPAGQYKQTVAHEIGTSPAFAYQAGTNGGASGIEDASDEGSYIREITRSVVYLPSEDKKSDTIITFDRFNNDDRNGVTPRRQVVFHMPVNPTVASATKLTWTAANGDNAELETLLPAAVARTPYDETKLGYGPSGSEAKWQVRISRAGPEPQFDSFLHVFTAHDAIVRSASLLSSGDGAQGALIHRAGLNDVGVIFNGRVGGTQTPSPAVDDAGYGHWNELVQDVLDHVHFFRTGYAITFASTTATTNLLLVDLDPSLSWTKNLDGAGASALTVDSQGVAQLSVPGATSHTLVIGGGTTEQQIQPLSLASQASNLTTGPSTSVSGTYTASGSATYLAVGGWIANAVDKTAGCTANGEAMTLIGKQLVIGDVWEYAYGIAAPASGTHTWTCSFLSSESADFVGQVYTGVKQVSTPDHVTLTLGRSPIGGNFTFSNTGTVPNVWQVAVVRANMIPAAEYRNTRTVRAGQYPRGGISMFDSGGPVSTIRPFTMETRQGGGFDSRYGAIMFSLAPAQ